MAAWKAISAMDAPRFLPAGDGLARISASYRALAERHYDLILIALTAFATLIHLAIPAGPISQNMMDIFTFIDGAYRIENGQIPHRDFISSLGSGTYFIYLIARRFVEDGLLIFWANLVFWYLLLPILFWLPRILSPHRLLPLMLIAFVAVMVPVNTDFGFQCGINYNTGYNRWGAALLLLCYSSYFGRPRDMTVSPFMDALMLIYAFFIKVNFFAVALVGLVLMAALRGRNRWPVAFAVALFAAVILALELSTGMISGYFRDLGMAAAVNQGAIVPLLVKVVKQNVIQSALIALLILLVGLASLYWLLRLKQRGAVSLPRILALLRPNLMAGYVLSTTIVSESQNLGGIGMISAVSVLAAPHALSPLLSPRLWSLARAGLAILILAPWLGIVALDGACMGRQALLQRAYKPFTDVAPDFSSFLAHERYIAEQFNPEMLERERSRRDWILHLDPRLYVFYMRELSDMLAAVRAQYPGARTRTLDFADPVPALLGSVPAPGSYIAMHHLRTISPASFVPPETLFHDIDVVLVPNCALFELNRDMVGLYEDYLKENFRANRLTRCWVAYDRILR